MPQCTARCHSCCCTPPTHGAATDHQSLSLSTCNMFYLLLYCCTAPTHASGTCHTSHCRLASEACSQSKTLCLSVTPPPACRHGKEAAASMYRRLPQLLLYRSHTLQRKTGVLTHSLGLTRKGANWLVQRNPRLLTFSADSMAGRLKGLVGLLGLEKREQLKDLVLAQPSLLYKSTENIAGAFLLLHCIVSLPSWFWPWCPV